MRTATMIKGGVHAAARCLGAMWGTAMNTPPSGSPMPETFPLAAQPAADTPSADVADRDLLAQVAAGREEAMMTLIQRYQAELYRVSLHITGRREDAEEAVQDAFLQIYRKAGSFEGRAAVRTWMYSIALNAARMRRRSQARHTDREVATLDDYFRDDGGFRPEVVSDQLPDREVMSREARAVIVRAIDALPDLDRTIVVLADQEEMSAREIAESTGLTEAAVKSRLHRARVALRKLLQEYVSASDIAVSPPAASGPGGQPGGAV